MPSNIDQVTPLLKQLKVNLETDDSLRDDLENKIKGVVVFVIDGEHWRLDLRPGKGSLTHESSQNASGSEEVDLTLTMKGSVFVALVSGKLGSQQAFLTRKLGITGSMGLAMKLQPILDAVLQVKSSL